MKQNIIVDKTFDFAVKIVPYCRWLAAEQRDYVLARQLLKSGTSIGANVEEATGGISKADFINKMQIGYKEARETRYWLRILNVTTPHPETPSLLLDCEEIIRILVAILKASKAP